MANLNFKVQKLFAGSASNNGQFGSAQVGTKIISSDPDTIQALAAWAGGWSSAVISGQRLLTVEELNGVLYVLSYGNVLTQQWGVQPWSADMTYNTGSITNAGGALYSSLQDSNTNKNPTSEPTWWEPIIAGTASDISVDDSAFSVLVGTDVQTVLDNLDNLLDETEVTLASGATVNLGAAASNVILINGTTNISSFGSAASTARPIYKIRFNGVLQLTYNSTSMILLGSSNITTANGDTATVQYLGSGNWKMLSYQRQGIRPNDIVQLTAGVYPAGDGTNITFPILPTVAAAIGFSSYYQSTQQACPFPNGTISLSHSLGTTPRWFMGFLQCVSNDSIWSVGDKMQIFHNYSANLGGFDLWVNSTTINLRYRNNSSSGYAFIGIDPTKWRVVLTAWA